MSRDRARAVADLLAELGVSRDRVKPSGADEPLLEREAKGPAGDLARAHNRRVEVVRGRTSPPTTGQPTVQPTLPTVQRDRWGVGPSAPGVTSVPMGKVPLEGMRLSKFGVGVERPGCEPLRGIKTIATDFLNALKKSPDQRLVIGGHSAKGEDASLAASRAEAVAALLRSLKVPAADIIDVAGYGNRIPMDKKPGGPLDRRVEIRVMRTTDFLNPGTDVDGRRRARQGRHRKRSDRDAGGPSPDDISKADIVQGLTIEVLGALGLEAVTGPLGVLVAPLVAYLGALANIEAAAVAEITNAYRDGLTRGSGNCWNELLRGKTTFPYDVIWPLVEKMAHWADYIPADQYKAEQGMSKGVNTATQLWDKMVEEVDHRTKLAVYDKLNKSGRSAVKEGDKVVASVIVDVRRAVAREMDDAIRAAATKIKAP